MSDQADALNIKHFSFSKRAAKEIQSWIDEGFFKDEDEVFDTGFHMVHTAVTQLRLDKKVVHFANVEVDVNVDVDVSAVKLPRELN